MTFFDKFIRPSLARVLMALLLPIAAALGQKIGMPISDETVRTIADIGAALVVYALGHRAINARVNPQDAAAPAPIENPFAIPERPDAR